jgi:SAM-dependent methyltransferase
MKQEIIWDFYQNKHPESFSNNYARLSFIVRRLPPRSRVLNIGVGNGLLEDLALQRNLDVFSVDPCEDTILNLKTKLGERARLGYSDRLPFDSGFFDAVVASEVLEHLSSTQLRDSLQEIKRVLKEGALFLGTVPCEEDLTANLVICPHCAQSFHRYGHFQTFSKDTLKILLTTCFQVVNIRRKKFVTFHRRRALYKISGALKILLTWLGVAVSDSNLYFSVKAIGNISNP